MVDPVSLGGVRPLPLRTKPTPEPARPVSSVVIQKANSLPKLVELAAELAAQGPPVDYVKIAQVRQAIADGSYRIDMNRLAGAILGFGTGSA